jgi:hypothetical protein
MNTLTPVATYIKQLLTKRWFVIVAILGYLLIAAYYMGPSITACRDTVYGFGDNTAGPIWKFSLPGNQSPLGNHENFTNFPFGESLGGPVGYSLLFQSDVLWFFAKLAGAVCGYNLVNLLGFVSSALVMCGFIYWLTRKRSIAFLSGFAVTFAPYYQFQVGGHPSYGYQGLLIGAVWLFFKVIKEHRRRDALLLGVVSGANFYWDPYFTLLISVILVSLGVAWFIYRIISLREPKKRSEEIANLMLELRRLLISLGVIVFMLLPLVAVKIHYASQINSYVSGSRGDGFTDATNCSIQPLDYILPADSNWFISKIFPSFSARVVALRHQCNPSEYTVGLNYAIGLTTFLGLIVFAWEKLNRRQLFKLPRGPDLRFAVIAALVMTSAAAALALPPRFGRITFPSDWLLQITLTWRILDRLYVVINIGVVTLFAIVLAYFSQCSFWRSISAKRISWYILFVLIFVQFQAFTPFHGSSSTFSYKKDLPSIYYWLAGQKDIKSIASYPMDKTGESENIEYYLTGNRVDGKHLLNSTLASGPQDPLRFSIKNLAAPQTLPILRELGIDAVQVDGISNAVLSGISGIKVLKFTDVSDPFMNGDMAVAMIEPGPKQDYAVLLETGFPLNSTIMKSAIDLQYEVQDKSVITVAPVLGGKDDSGSKPVCFEIKTADPTETDTFSVKAGKTTLVGPMAINGTYTPVQFSAPEGESLTLTDSTSHDMRMDQLGCQQ